MTPRRRGVIELLLAALALCCCVLSWLQSQSTVQVAPIAAGEHSTMSITFYAPLLVLALVLLTVAGVLVVLATTHFRQGSGDGSQHSSG